MKFELGRTYTRPEINERVGGSLVSYLPTVGGKVVCACLRKQQNPDAPNAILVTSGKQIVRAGKILCEQDEAIPIFIKRGKRRWDYVGDYEVESCDWSGSNVHNLGEVAGVADVAGVVRMKPVESGPN